MSSSYQTVLPYYGLTVIILKMLLFIIASFSLASFYFGITSLLNGRYKPKVFSRLIWFFITINTFVGVVRLNSYLGIELLAGMQMIIGLAILLGSLKYSVWEFRRTELFSSLLLTASLLIWLFFDIPFLNIIISLVAHLIGGIPTIARVWNHPTSEYTAFWTYFGIGSLISVAFAPHDDIKSLVYPLYFAIFNGAVVILSLRKSYSFARIWH
jgi:hypothetical protein